MSFHDKVEEQEYLNQQWNDNRKIIQIFAITIFIHSFYIVFIYNIYDVAFTPTLIVFVYGIYIPVSTLVLILSFLQPIRHHWSRVLWYISISIVSIMVGTGIGLRNIFCHYGVEPQHLCTTESRPVSNAEYAIIYVILGPLLVLNIFRNNLKYQMTAIVIMLIVVIWGLVVTRQHELLLWFSIVFIIGAQLMGILVERARNLLQRSKFISDINNRKLSDYLSREIVEKTKAQEKAKEEEDKRTQFTNMLFHEVRVPLNSVILSMNDLEAEDFGLRPDALENMDRINSGLNAIINIINDSLDFRRMSEGKLQIVEKPFSYHDMINEVTRSMESSWKAKDIIFEKQLDDTIDGIGYKILGDSNRLRQVVANYISNAVKFTPNGGTITLKTKLDERKNGNIWVYTEVKDTGIGIKKENQADLFKPFVQIDPEKLQGGKGSGLGLSIVANIINSMNGVYGVNSTYGVGSTFWFRVKLAITTIPIMKTIDTSKPETPEEITKRYRILVTDDDLNTRKIMRKLLERLGHETEGAADGIECLEKIAIAIEAGKPYDVLFLDNQMPRLGGFETLKILRQQFKIPVIMLTGSSEIETLQEFKNIGANEVLLKPATIQMINSALHKVNVI
jgi:signal transduction histidine kinase/CheY-like chemotaxis protein